MNKGRRSKPRLATDSSRSNTQQSEEVAAIGVEWLTRAPVGASVTEFTNQVARRILRDDTTEL